MNWDRIEGSIKQIKGKARRRWGQLVDDEVDVRDGRREELSGRMQQRYGVSRDLLKRSVRELGAADPGSQPWFQRGSRSR